MKGKKENEERNEKLERKCDHLLLWLNGMDVERDCLCLCLEKLEWNEIRFNSEQTVAEKKWVIKGFVCEAFDFVELMVEWKE